MGRWNRINPDCPRTECAYNDGVFCGILNNVQNSAECNFFKAKLQKAPEPVAEPEPEPEPTDWVGSNKARIERMWN